MADKKKSTRSGVMKATGILVVTNMLSSLLGYVRDIIMSSTFGMKGELAAYNAAFTIPDTIYTVLVMSTARSLLLRNYRKKDTMYIWLEIIRTIYWL